MKFFLDGVSVKATLKIDEFGDLGLHLNGIPILYIESNGNFIKCYIQEEDAEKLGIDRNECGEISGD